MGNFRVDEKEEERGKREDGSGEERDVRKNGLTELKRKFQLCIKIVHVSVNNWGTGEPVQKELDVSEVLYIYIETHTRARACAHL